VWSAPEHIQTEFQQSRTTMRVCLGTSSYAFFLTKNNLVHITM